MRSRLAGSVGSGRVAGLNPGPSSATTYTASVGVNAVDVCLSRTDHPVDMNEALVAALRRDLLRGQLVTTDEAFRVALAERDMGSSVLVEQGVEEQQSAFGDRRGMRHQRHFAETRRAFVGVEHLLQHLLATRGFCLDDAAFLEPDCDVVDQGALIGQRL